MNITSTAKFEEMVFEGKVAKHQLDEAVFGSAAADKAFRTIHALVEEAKEMGVFAEYVAAVND